ncbi:chlorophyll synthesis pathway protein BchC [Lamprobacter modestohalophilus]|uniref:chlorophyll synthesis pathway protein BchC n=1 Tax=Lamprobacter modestohalophilus TaxID=1064514 RepID=UPI002ADEE920|nr:chlorophyll synthesis pathway protein BchC [Lamprobacter modestohalophilus]MEA1049915.1 chlorophyll synthesis pathway protein BchC [Lamprobacter modestohalophilus]
MSAFAVVLDQPRQLALKRLQLTPAADADCVVDIDFSGISTGTERLLWTGRMPPFPGMGYPLVPGYESVGRVIKAGVDSGRSEGELVFVPGARCYGDVNGLFGGAASRVVVPGARLLPIPDDLGEQGVLMALAATAHHAIAGHGKTCPDLIVGHGVLGRLLARVAIALGAPPPVVWETNPKRAAGAVGYDVVDPQTDSRVDYTVICDVSGDSALLDQLIARLARGGEIVLAGFYEAPLSFQFPPAFMRELRLRVAAEFREADLMAVRGLIEAGALSLEGLITHRYAATEAATAYETAFDDPTCLKMVLDWRGMNG